MRPTTANRLIVINYSTCATEIIVVIIVQHGATVLNHTARDTLKYSTAAVDFSVIHATKTVTIRRTKNRYNAVQHAGGVDIDSYCMTPLLSTYALRINGSVLTEFDANSICIK